MAKISRIMVPTDLSRLSEAAFAYATMLAKKHRAKMYLVHVMDPAPVLAPTALGMSTETFDRRMKKEEENLLRRVAKRLGKAETILRKGNVTDELLSVARAKKADLIVMSTHGRSGIGHVLLGSVAEKIVRKSGCPVLTVKPSR